MKKNEIRTDRKHPLTTPEYASVLQSTMSSSKRSPSGRKEPKGQILFRKRGKRQSIFLFPKKKSLLLLFSYLFFNSTDMTLIPGVSISTLSQ